MGNLHLSKSRVFLGFCIAFIAGAFLGRYVSLEIMAVLAMVFIMVGSLGFGHRAGVVAGLSGLMLVVGMFSWNISGRSPEGTNYVNKKLSITGVVVEEPDERIDKTLLTLGKLNIDGKSVKGRILATVQRFPEYNYGDEISFESKIIEPKDADPGEFSYKNYLSRYGIWGLVYYPKTEVIDDKRANPVKGAILAFKEKFMSRLSEVLPEPHNSFLAGILVGARRGIPADLQEKFNITGTTHIIAISGFNITIIAWAIDRLLQRFGRRVSFIASLIAIVLFVILTGAQASVVRAGVMGSLGVIALNIGRLYAINNALAFTAALMVALNPRIIHFDVGFQLSFMALLGLIYLTEPIQNRLMHLPVLVRMPLSATLAAQAATLPILLFNFDRLSLVAPLTNVLILPIIPVIMATGFAAGALSLASTILALPFAWVTWGLVEYVIRMIEITSRIPLSSMQFSIPPFIIPLYYVMLVLLLNYFSIKTKIEALLERWKPKPETQSSL